MAYNMKCSTRCSKDKVEKITKMRQSQQQKQNQKQILIQKILRGLSDYTFPKLIQSTIRMFRKLFERSENIYPQFRKLCPTSLLPSFLNELGNNMFYTPKIQKIMYSDELVKYMAYLSRKKTVLPQDMRQFTQNILTEYANAYTKTGIQDEKFGFERNYRIPPGEGCPYHGTVDYMVYLNKQHFFPLMFFQNQLNVCAGPGLAMSNMVMKAKLRQQQKTSGYALITNGQQWIMYKVYRSLKLQKSVVYEGKNNKFKNIYQDYEMTSVLMGLVDYCLDVEREDVETLKIAYDFIDEQKFMLEAKEGEKIKNSPAGKMLTDYYQKKKDWQSK